MLYTLNYLFATFNGGSSYMKYVKYLQIPISFRRLFRRHLDQIGDWRVQFRFEASGDWRVPVLTQHFPAVSTILVHFPQTHGPYAPFSRRTYHSGLFAAYIRHPYAPFSRRVIHFCPFPAAVIFAMYRNKQECFMYKHWYFRSNLQVFRLTVITHLSYMQHSG